MNVVEGLRVIRERLDLNGANDATLATSTPSSNGVGAVRGRRRRRSRCSS
jgi:hypothetical protein